MGRLALMIATLTMVGCASVPAEPPTTASSKVADCEVHVEVAHRDLSGHTEFTPGNTVYLRDEAEPCKG